MVLQGDKQMARTTKQTSTPATPGFAIEIKDYTKLGLAILVVVIAPGTEVPGPGGTSLLLRGLVHYLYLADRPSPKAATLRRAVTWLENPTHRHLIMALKTAVGVWSRILAPNLTVLRQLRAPASRCPTSSYSERQRH